MTTGHSATRLIRKLMPAAAAGLMGAVLGQAPVAAQPAPPPVATSGAPAATAAPATPARPAAVEGLSDFVVPGDVPLGRPLETPPATSPVSVGVDPYGPTRPFVVPNGVPSGFTGPTSILPSVYQVDGHFVPVEDRWRLGFPRMGSLRKGTPTGGRLPL